MNIAISEYLTSTSATGEREDTKMGGALMRRYFSISNTTSLGIYKCVNAYAYQNIHLNISAVYLAKFTVRVVEFGLKTQCL